MLTRDGERVLEILLIAAGLALTVMFQNSLPGGQALPENQGGRLEEPGFVQQVHGLDLDEPRQAPASTLATATIQQALSEAAAMLAVLGPPSGRC
ncbi:MAG: hypothetical protein CMP07_03700 [Xanthomonadales bacterium]|nr:hypothetical protein [Xanthomonadales bacterium]